jgi:hypothetical protein
MVVRFFILIDLKEHRKRFKNLKTFEFLSRVEIRNSFKNKQQEN